MKVSETIFDPDGKPLGWIEQEAMSGAVGFRPREGVAPLPDRPWRDVDELREALLKLYGKPK
jgi:hypothetical protein